MVLVGNIAIVLVGSFGIIAMLTSQLKRRQAIVATSYKVISEESVQKKTILSELSEIAAGLCNPEEITVIKKKREELEEAFAEEQGKVAIAEAQIQTIEGRLREIEELERELEMSTIEAHRELELLKDQERLMREETERLRQTLTSSMESLDKLIQELSSSQIAVEKLTAAKGELVNTEKKMDYYTEEISRLNGLYMDLKKGYDALDIEYAQLYERQNSVL